MKKIALVLALLLSLTLCLAGCVLFDSSDDYEYSNAYDVAVANGYEGTVDEWLESLVGEKGDSGTVEVIITDNSENSAFAVSKALSSSVSIVCTVTGGTSSGSGVVYQMEANSTYSYIVTNYHVVYDGNESGIINVDYIANTIKVYPYGSTTAISATFVGGSIDEDIAVLAVSTSALSSANMQAVSVGGDVTTGERIYVVGNAEAEGISATTGIVSVYRTDISITAIDNDSEINTISCIQIDAAVNGGNSGGGLFDSEGNWIGVVNAKMVAEEIEGMGYAIPVSVAEPITAKLISAFESNNYSSGVSIYEYLTGVTTTVSSSNLAYDSDGLVYINQTVQISSVTTSSVASVAGLKSGDILVSATLDSSLYGGTISVDITKSYQLSELLLWATTNDSLTVTVNRSGTLYTYTMDLSNATASLIY